MAKRTNNDLQNTTQKETIQWPRGQTMIYKTLHRRRDNTMAKRTNNDLLVGFVLFDL
jgi:hypothetical protein